MSLAFRPVDIFQVFGETPQTLAEVLQDGVNLAVWRRRLPAQLQDFAELVLSLGQPLTDQRVIEVHEQHAPVLPDLLREAADLHGYESFVADVTWLVAAYTCLVGARRVGLRLRVLDGPMCPRFHVDNVPLRLLTTYVGPGSEWLPEAISPRRELHTAQPLWIKFKPFKPVMSRCSRARNGKATKAQVWFTARLRASRGVCC